MPYVWATELIISEIVCLASGESRPKFKVCDIKWDILMNHKKNNLLLDVKYKALLSVNKVFNIFILKQSVASTRHK